MNTKFLCFLSCLCCITAALADVKSPEAVSKLSKTRNSSKNSLVFGYSPSTNQQKVLANSELKADDIVDIVMVFFKKMEIAAVAISEGIPQEIKEHYLKKDPEFLLFISKLIDKINEKTQKLKQSFRKNCLQCLAPDCKNANGSADPEVVREFLLLIDSAVWDSHPENIFKRLLEAFSGKPLTKEELNEFLKLINQASSPDTNQPSPPSKEKDIVNNPLKSPSPPSATDENPNAFRR